MDTRHRKISVHSHSGYRTDELPRKVEYQGHLYRIRSVLMEEKVLIAGEGEFHRRFLVELEDRRRVDLCYHEGEDQWYLVGPFPQADVIFVDFKKRKRCLPS